MDRPESFEVTEYGEGDGGVYDRSAAIKQVMSVHERDNPAHAVIAKIAGNVLTLAYHCYEMHLPVRMKQVVAGADDVFRETVSFLKKEVKKLGLKLDLKEMKDQADHTVEKVSMNERYYVIFLRHYEMR